MSLQFTRKREGNGKFRYVTGGERQPISYRSIFGGCTVPGQGLNDTPNTGNKKPVPPIDPKQTAASEANSST